MIEYAGIPSIIIISYLVGEIFKLFILKIKRNYKYIPVIVGTIGGILGVISYFISPEIVLNVESPLTALALGIVSGLASTGGNELIKQIIKNKEKENE